MGRYLYKYNHLCHIDLKYDNREIHSFLPVDNMLQELAIRNFAIIDDLQIRFRSGMTILSGETGAGKSIVIQAVNLLLGSRASVGMIRTGAESAELEAVFRIGKNSPVARTMISQGYTPDDDLLIRRVISRNNRHRTYINGSLATINVLNAIVENLASISGQHAHQILLKKERHLEILDLYGGLDSLRSKVNDLYSAIQPMIAELNRLITIRDGRSEHLRLLAFQRDEILKSGITPGEDEQLEIKRQRLKHAEALHQAIYNSIEALYAMEGAAIERLADAEQCLEKARQIDPQLDNSAKKIAETALSVEDLTETLRSYLSTVKIDEAQLEAVEERLDTLIKLKHKYGGTLAAVMDHLETGEKELAKVENISENISALEIKINNQHHHLGESCRELSKKRTIVARRLAREVESQLVSLRMDNTRFKVELLTQPATVDTPPYLCVDGNLATENGIDQAMFMIAPNVGEVLKPLNEIASGGELSRVVLALKVILAGNDSVGTVVFDEVDAGIGGGTAEVVGRKLADLAKSHQVVCITHLPQIARFGNHHFRIDKEVTGGRTVTVIEPIDREQRVREIARMLGGEKITRKTIAHAREMLESP